jgi:hypothetical protein
MRKYIQNIIYDSFTQERAKQSHNGGVWACCWVYRVSGDLKNRYEEYIADHFINVLEIYTRNTWAQTCPNLQNRKSQRKIL